MDKIGIQGIDVEIQIVFLNKHTNLISPHFEKVGICKSTINEMIDSYISSGEKVSYERWFLEYGQTVINPIMNKKLGRSVDHPTFNNLLRHALKDIIASHPIICQFKKYRSKI